MTPTVSWVLCKRLLGAWHLCHSTVLSSAKKLMDDFEHQDLRDSKLRAMSSFVLEWKIAEDIYSLKFSVNKNEVFYLLWWKLPSADRKIRVPSKLTRMTPAIITPGAENASLRQATLLPYIRHEENQTTN